MSLCGDEDLAGFIFIEPIYNAQSDVSGGDALDRTNSSCVSNIHILWGAN